MRRLLAAVVLVASLAAVASGSARDPRLEQVRLNAADNALARRIAVQPADVGAGWRRTTIPKAEQRLTCPGFRPDFSRFTITGKATTGFAQRTGAAVVSAVEVYESRADAVGDFRMGAKPAVARCLKLEIDRQFRAAAVPGRVLSARVVPAPRVGERRLAIRLVATLEAGANLRLYVDVVAVQRGRSIAAVFFTAPTKPLRGQSRIVAAVASRMR